MSDEGVKDCLDLLDLMGKTVTILLDDIVTKVARSRLVDFDGLPVDAYDGRPRLPEQELVKRLEVKPGITCISLYDHLRPDILSS